METKVARNINYTFVFCLRRLLTNAGRRLVVHRQSGLHGKVNVETARKVFYFVRAICFLYIKKPVYRYEEGRSGFYDPSIRFQNFNFIVDYVYRTVVRRVL